MDFQEILDALRGELGKLALAGQSQIADTVAFTEARARELAAMRGDPGFATAVDIARRRCILRAASNAVLAADAADDAGWNAAFGVVLKALSAAAV